ncbi:MAG: GNAT family N-acetyltransferase [Chitinophagaceae bacterium]|nr:GNAT family N-acetyltransferase [Chitinophagaceae bacterium]
MNITIRKAEPEDFTTLFSLFREFATFQNTPEKVLITPEQLLKDKDEFHCFVATVNERIVGFATWFAAYYSWAGKSVYLDDLYVSSEFRGYGIGKQLFDQVIETARELQCKKVRWLVSCWNKKAIEFYKLQGATVQEGEFICDLMLH